MSGHLVIRGLPSGSGKAPSKGALSSVMRQAERDRLIRSTLEDLSEHVQKLIEERHNYPVWPERDIEDYPLDSFEAQYHGEIRKIYYQNTIFLIHLLKTLRL